MAWGTVVAAVFSIGYATCPHLIFSALTSDTTVIATAMDYRWWAVMIPFVGTAAFVWDGVYIGLTWSRGMLAAVATASIAFFSLYFALSTRLGNNSLWVAFVTYLAVRGLVQTVAYCALTRKKRI